MRPPPGFSIDLILSYLPPHFFNSLPAISDSGSSPPSEINKVAFIMALCGWEGHIHERLGEQLGSVSCQACFRVLGLWIFKSKEVNEAGEELAEAVVNHLDVVKEHREYCPWKNAASQNGQKATTQTSTSAMAGWEVLLRLLKNDHHLRTRQGNRSKQPSMDNATEVSSMVGTEVDDDGDMSIRDTKDKERWARLRRVKSLFDTKAGKKLSRK